MQLLLVVVYIVRMLQLQPVVCTSLHILAWVAVLLTDMGITPDGKLEWDPDLLVQLGLCDQSQN